MEEKVKHLIVSSLTVLLLAACGSGRSTDDETRTPVRVSVMEVAQADIGLKGHFSGTVEEKNGTALSFSTTGTIRTLNLRLGDRIHRGQLLGTLDDTSARSSHEAALATLRQAEDAYTRMKELHDKGSLAEIKWVEVQSKLEQARSMETVARKMLDDCRLTAPYSGVIAEKLAEAGQNVMPGQPVARLVSAEGQEVHIAVPEGEIARVTMGQKAVIRVPALDGKSYQATVSERGVTADKLSRAYPVRLRVDNADAALLPGMVVEVDLLVPGSEQVCVVPVSIVQLDEQNHTFVWVDEGGQARKRIVRCGDFAGDGVTVTDGLQPGDRVIVEGQHKVCNGTSIAPVPATPSEVRDQTD